jgi:hypothetical protein
MSELTIKKSNAVKAYKEADDKGKKMLENLFGTKLIPSPEEIITHGQACDILGKNPEDDIIFKHPATKRQEATNANEMIWTVAEAINGPDYDPDYGNTCEAKWYPVYRWDSSKSAFVFVSSDCERTFTRAGCGPRLCFKSEKLSNHFGRTFIDLMNKVLIKNPK